MAHLWAGSKPAPSTEAVGTSLGGRGCVATWPTCGALLILPPGFKRWRPPRRDYVATRPTCGPPLILTRALKRWGSPRRQGLCSHPAHL